MSVTIELSKFGKYCGQFTTVVDDIDSDLALLSWRVHFSGKNHYAKRTIYKSGCIYLHQEIAIRMFGAAALEGRDVDHENRNGLDNQRQNIRVATYSQNSVNRRIQSNNTSGFRGVSWHWMGRRWIAEIWVEKKKHYLGLFETPAEAALAYDIAAKKFLGDLAQLNFPTL